MLKYVNFQAKRPGNEEIIRISLVPELCYVTGMSEAMRSDFRVMKDVGEHTRLVPQAREKVNFFNLEFGDIYNYFELLKK